MSWTPKHVPCYIGNQAQAMLQWKASRHFKASVVYAHFFPGDFLAEGPAANDVNYVSA